MNDHTKTRITTLSLKAAPAAIALVSISLAWISIPNLFGNLLVETTSVLSPNAKEVAQLSMALAADDPQVRNMFALTRDDQTEVVATMEDTVEQAPSDPKWRVSLGRAYEQIDQIDKAEIQFKKAVDLAPNHANPRWHLGNFYLRQGREEEAFEELRVAAADHARFREQVFSLVWDYSNGDPAQLERVAAHAPEPKAYLARFLAQRGLGAPALSLWDQLEPADKQRFQGVAWWMIQELYAKGNYRQAQEIARQIGQTNSTPESVSNPSFEEPVFNVPQDQFNWQVLSREKGIAVDLDSQVKRSGGRSLRITFRGQNRSDLSDVYQTIVVNPETNYVINHFFSTEGLRSPVRPALQVVSANDNQVLGTSEMFPPDLSEWTRSSIQFRTGKNTSAVSIRTFRPSCGEQCALAGVVWYDDFELIRR